MYAQWNHTPLHLMIAETSELMGYRHPQTMMKWIYPADRPKRGHADPLFQCHFSFKFSHCRILTEDYALTDPGNAKSDFYQYIEPILCVIRDCAWSAIQEAG